MFRILLDPEDFAAVIDALEHYNTDPKVNVRLRTRAGVIWNNLTNETSGWVTDLDPEAAMQAARIRDPLADMDNEGLTRNTEDIEQPSLSDIMAGLLANRKRIEELGKIIQEAQPKPKRPVLVPVRDPVQDEFLERFSMPDPEGKIS